MFNAAKDVIGPTTPRCKHSLKTNNKSVKSTAVKYNLSGVNGSGIEPWSPTEWLGILTTRLQFSHARADDLKQLK